MRLLRYSQMQHYHAGVQLLLVVLGVLGSAYSPEIRGALGMSRGVVGLACAALILQFIFVMRARPGVYLLKLRDRRMAQIRAAAPQANAEIERPRSCEDG